MSELRISFEEAIAEARLLKPRFSELSLPQQVALKALYGCPLTSRSGAGGLSELDWWSAQQGEGVYDALGRLIEIRRQVPYTPKEYREGWIVGGRRGGKTDAFASTIVAYEAVCGGHEEHIRRGQRAVCYQIAQDLRMARYSLHFIRATLESMRFIAKGKITDITADRIDLWNGITIATVPPTTKSVRGYANPVAVFDEIGVWRVEEDAADPDAEVYRAVSPGQAQFPHAKIVAISSPWAKAGLLYKHFDAGTDGSHLPAGADPDPYRGKLVIHFTSASSGNPRVTTEWLTAELAKDPRAFERECLAKFQDSLSGFLPTTLIREAVDRGVQERPPAPLNFYVAAIDPAFRNDAFGFALCHVETRPTGDSAIVFDVIRQWKAPHGDELDPGLILDEITPILRAYRVLSVLSDQYQFESLSKLAIDRGWAIENFRFTGTSKQSIYGNLRSLLLQKRLRLLDHPATIHELSKLEARMTRQRQMQIAAPDGEHDDLATVVALAASRATWLFPDAPKSPEQTEIDSARAATAYERQIESACHAQVARKRTHIIQAHEGWD